VSADLLRLLLANGCLLAAGAGVTRALGAWRHPSDLRRVLGVSFLAGVAAFGVTAQLLYVLGLSLDLLEALALCGALAAIGALRLVPRTQNIPWAPIVRMEWVAAALVAIPLFLLAVDAAVMPLSSWDAWSQWTPKARALILLPGLDPAVFANAAYANWHPDYPLLVPAVEAFALRFIDLDQRVVHLEFWFLLAGCIVALLELLRPRAGALLAWSAVLAIVWTPKIGAEALSANADFPLAVFLVLAGITAWLWVSEGNVTALGLFVLFGAATLATKLEGTFELGIVIVAALVLAARRSRKRAAILLGAGALSLVGLVPWRIWTTIHDTPTTYPPGSVINRVTALEPQRVPIASLVLVHQLFDPSGWLLLVPLALCAALVGALGMRRRATLVAGAATMTLVGIGVVTALVIPGHSFPWSPAYWLLFVPEVFACAVFLVVVVRHGGTSGYVTGIAAAMCAAFVGVYLFTPYNFAWHLGTSSSRVVLPIGLFLAAFIPLLLHRAFDHRGEIPVPGTSPSELGLLRRTE
jgi:hypothetical protein